MNDQEKYLFDLRGYLVVKNALTERQRAMLMPPSAYGPHEHTRAIWEKAQEEQAELKRLRDEKS